MVLGVKPPPSILSYQHRKFRTCEKLRIARRVDGSRPTSSRCPAGEHIGARPLALEDIWVRDIVDFTWEIFSLRRLKANLMTAIAYKGVEAVLEPITDFDDADTLATKWAARNPSAIKRVNKILDSAGLTMDAVIAQTLSQNLDFVERIERMITVKESSRNAILREIDRHSATLAHTLRETVHQLEHGEIQAVDDTQSVEAKNAA
jgi:hypothetical protein